MRVYGALMWSLMAIKKNLHIQVALMWAAKKKKEIMYVCTYR